MNFTIFDFVKAYCNRYNVEEDNFNAEDVEYIEDTWYNYCSCKELPDYMRSKLCVVSEHTN